jgi:hypothetical protein
VKDPRGKEEEEESENVQISNSPSGQKDIKAPDVFSIWSDDR